MSWTALTLCSGPKLMYQQASCDEPALDVTDRACEFLFLQVKIAADAVLWDVLKLLDNPLMKIVFRGDYVDELLTEATLGPLVKNELPYQQVECIELSQFWYLNSATSEFTSVGKFGVTGKGICQPEDIVDHGTILYKKGDRIQWGVSMSSIREFLLLPVQLNSRVALCEGNVHAERYGDILQTGVNNQITLGMLIHSLLWGLTWYETPERRDERICDIREMKSEGNAGTEKPTE